MKTLHIETGSHVLRGWKSAVGILTLVTDEGSIEVTREDLRAGRVSILNSTAQRVDLSVSRELTIWTHQGDAANMRFALGIN